MKDNINIIDIIKYFNSLSTVILGIIIIVIAFFLIQRAKSPYNLVNRLYSLLFGKVIFKNNKLESFWQERSELERFNALFNINAGTISELHNFIQWIKRYDIDVRVISKIKKQFNINKLAIKKHSKKYIWLIILNVLLFYILFFLSLNITLKNSSLIRWPQEETPWMWVNNNQISNYIPNLDIWNDKKIYWNLSKEEICQKDINLSNITKETGLSNSFIKKLCISFNDSQFHKKLDNTLKEQRFYFLFFSLILIFVMFFLALKEIFNTCDSRQHLCNKLKLYREKKRSIKKFI